MTLDVAVRDMVAECEDLDALLRTIPAADWQRRTVFFDWTVAEQVMHLHLVDGFGRVALETPEAFPDLVAEVRAGQARGFELSDRMRAHFGDLPAGRLRETWEAGWRGLAAALGGADPELRMPWFGPPMGVASFAAARQMEVWAHGQDIYDLLRVRRTNHDRIRAVCDLGVRTQGWSFKNRALDRPAPPEVTLTAPSGAIFRWNEGAAERIAGPAEDFALVVTQRRHVDDTALTTEGPGARAWMEIAQCFAGAAETGPAPGARRIDYSA